jgi:hypothetical protein
MSYLPLEMEYLASQKTTSPPFEVKPTRESAALSPKHLVSDFRPPAVHLATHNRAYYISATTLYSLSMPWMWSSPTSAGNAKAGPSTPLQPIGTAPPASESSAGPSSNHVEQKPISSAQQVRSTSETIGQASGSAPARYERLLKDEETYQAKQFPSFEEVPGCMQLL